MSHPQVPRPLAVCLIALAAVTAETGAVSAQSRIEPAQPRLAWLGSERPTFERNSRPHDRNGYSQPALVRDMWSGFYAGLHGGYSWATAEPASRYDSIDFDGGTLGAHLGYNWQWSSLVLGAEGDLGWQRGHGTRTFADPAIVDVHASLISSLRLRAGLAVDNALFYVTGGLAFANVHTDLTTGLGQTSSSDLVTGYAVGGGIEMKITSNLSGRVEALYYGFDNKRLGALDPLDRADLSATTLRAGLTYRFD